MILRLNTHRCLNCACIHNNPNFPFNCIIQPPGTLEFDCDNAVILNIEFPLMTVSESDNYIYEVSIIPIYLKG